MRVSTWVQAAVVAAAAVAAGVPWSAPAVERWYATGLYPRLQQVVTPASNVLPFALFDVLTIGAAVGVIAMVVRAVRSARRMKRVAPLLSALVGLTVAGAGLYLAFLLLWGLNYRRVPMAERLLVTDVRADSDAVTRLGLEAVAQMNRLHGEAHRTGWPGDEWRDPRLRMAFAETQRLLSDATSATPGRLKWTIFGLYFRWASVDGMVNPFALEVLGNPDLLPWERPFVLAHEWSHLAGYAHEAEANFVGWLTCVRGDATAQYSGWMYLYWQIAGEVAASQRGRLASALEPGPRRDLEAIVERVRRGRFQLVSNASWVMYDQYLRANRVEGGIRSYGEVVTLIVRARFEKGWIPVRRHGGSPR